MKVGNEISKIVKSVLDVENVYYTNSLNKNSRSVKIRFNKLNEKQEKEVLFRIKKELGLVVISSKNVEYDGNYGNNEGWIVKIEK